MLFSMVVFRGWLCRQQIALWDCSSVGKVFHWRLFALFLSFLSLRLPYVFGVRGFALVIVMVVFFLYLSLFLGRLANVGEFFARFVVEGTPEGIASFICLADTLRYYVRPLVLMLRPFVNLRVGGTLGGASASYVWCNSWVIWGVCVLFFYEVFVALVHWFIVCRILSFSEKH